MNEMTMNRRVIHWISHHVHFFIFGWLCITWFLFRTGTKPSRIVYPCQQASIAGAHLWFAAYLLPLVSILRSPGNGRGRAPVYMFAGIIVIAIIIGALIFQGSLNRILSPKRCRNRTSRRTFSW